MLTTTTQPQEGPQAAGWALCPPGLTGQPCFTVTSSHPSGIHRLLPAQASPPSHLCVAGRGSALSHKAQASLLLPRDLPLSSKLAGLGPRPWATTCPACHSHLLCLPEPLAAASPQMFEGLLLGHCPPFLHLLHLRVPVNPVQPQDAIQAWFPLSGLL